MTTSSARNLLSSSATQRSEQIQREYPLLLRKMSQLSHYGTSITDIVQHIGGNLSDLMGLVEKVVINPQDNHALNQLKEYHQTSQPIVDRMHLVQRTVLGFLATTNPRQAQRFELRDYQGNYDWAPPTTTGLEDGDRA